MPYLRTKKRPQAADLPKSLFPTISESLLSFLTLSDTSPGAMLFTADEWFASLEIDLIPDHLPSH